MEIDTIDNFDFNELKMDYEEFKEEPREVYNGYHYNEKYQEVHLEYKGEKPTC